MKMKLSLFICVVLCCATLVSTGPAWKKILKKLKKSVKPYTDFVHVVSNQGSPANFREVKQTAVLLTQIVNDLGGGIANDKSRIGFIQFTLNAYHEIRLSSFQALGSMQNRINSIRFRPGNFAAVGEGLKAARNQFNWHSSQDKKKAVWLVTHSYSEVGADAKDEAKLLKAKGIKVFVIGIGKINRWNELKKLATSNGYAFAFEKYNDYRKAVLQAVKKL